MLNQSIIEEVRDGIAGIIILKPEWTESDVSRLRAVHNALCWALGDEHAQDLRASVDEIKAALAAGPL